MKMTFRTFVQRVVVGLAACAFTAAMPAAGQPGQDNEKLSFADRAPFCGDPDQELGERYSKAVLADVKARERAGARGAAEAIAAMRSEYCNGHEVRK